jgi:uncharacterized HAD superfamily protein
MKINLSSLMCLIDENERQYSSLFFALKKHVLNTSIQELNGTTNIVEDNKKDFQEELAEVERLSKEITKLKNILYEKNNSFKLSDGRTIQSAIVENSNLRKLKDNLQTLLNYRNLKQRVTEVNNSYFQIQEINYNQEEINSQIQQLDLKIRNTDFEISKLNSIEFDIDL